MNILGGVFLGGGNPENEGGHATAQTARYEWKSNETE